MVNRPTRQDRYRGALLGLAAGDALGTTLEFTRPGTFPPLTGMTGGGPFNLPPGATAPALASAIDFVLEGLYAQRKISRSDERGYTAGTEASGTPRRGRREEPSLEEEIRFPGGKKKYYN